MTDQVIIGFSHMKGEVGYGDTSSQEPSSKVPGDPPIKRSSTAQKIIGKPVTVPSDAATIAGMNASQTRPMSSKQAVPTSFGMSGPAPSAKVPTSTVRRANDGLLRRTRK
jgi:hypothetical protein